jgi:AsmA protein
MRPLKILGIALGSFVALLVLLLLGVWLFVNPNDYKGRVEKMVGDSTGRQLILSGDIKLSVFPWIALQLGPATLGNPPGFGSQPFAGFAHAALSVKLLPLLHKELQIGHVEIDDLDLRLLKNAQGKGNWEQVGKSSTAAAESPSSGSTALPQLAGLVIKNGRLSYQELVAEQVNLEVGQLSAGHAAPVKLDLRLITSRGAQPINLASRLDVMLDPATKQYRVGALELEGALPTKRGAAAMAWKFSAPQVSADLAAQTLSAPSFTALLGTARLSGELHGSKLLDAPNFTGEFKLDPVVLREFLAQLGVAVPATRDPKALSKLAASGRFAYGNDAVRADKLDMQLDDSHMRGAAAITNLDTKTMSFDLALDRIDVDSYLSPAKPAAKPVAKAPTQPVALPSNGIKTLQLKGTATVGGLKIAGIALSQVHVGVTSNDGVMHIAPLQAKLYGGTYTGEITLDERAATPTLKLEQSMNDVDVAQLLRDFAKTQRISGHGNVTTNLTAHGDTSTALMSSLSGHVAANLANGAVDGLDLWFELSRALALIQKQPLPAGNSTGRTKFDTFKASADLVNGVATTKDLNIASQNLRVTGQGTSNLNNEAIDYRVKATVLKGAPGGNLAGAKTLADIPVMITGTMGAPKVRPDIESLAKQSLQQEVQHQLQDKLKDLLR